MITTPSISCILISYLFLIRSELNNKGSVHSRSHFMSHIIGTNDLEIWRVSLSNFYQSCNLKSVKKKLMSGCMQLLDKLHFTFIIVFLFCFVILFSLTKTHNILTGRLLTLSLFLSCKGTSYV